MQATPGEMKSLRSSADSMALILRGAGVGEDQEEESVVRIEDTIESVSTGCSRDLHSLSSDLVQLLMRNNADIRHAGGVVQKVLEPAPHHATSDVSSGRVGGSA